MPKLRTPLCDLLGIDVPVMQAGMGDVAYGRIAAPRTPLRWWTWRKCSPVRSNKNTSRRRRGSGEAALMRLHHDDPTADWTVSGVYEVDTALYRIPLPLPHDSPRAVNVYAEPYAKGLI
jgi:hypothetical protein